MLFRPILLLTAAMMLLTSAFAIATATYKPDPDLDLDLDLDLNFNGPAYADSPLPHEERMLRKWRGEATIEVYMASDTVNNVGNVTGSPLYGLIYRVLTDLCPVTVGGRQAKSCWGVFQSFDTKYIEDGGAVKTSKNQIHVIRSKYKSKQVRNLLIGALAGAYEAATDLNRNCYFANDPSAEFRFCNVPVQVGAYTEDSYIPMSLNSDIIDDNDGGWNCCETRELVDAKLDGLLGELKSVYPTPRSMVRNVECHLGCANGQTESNIDVDRILVQIKKLRV